MKHIFNSQSLDLLSTAIYSYFDLYKMRERNHNSMIFCFRAQNPKYFIPAPAATSASSPLQITTARLGSGRPVVAHTRHLLAQRPARLDLGRQPAQLRDRRERAGLPAETGGGERFARAGRGAAVARHVALFVLGRAGALGGGKRASTSAARSSLSPRGREESVGAESYRFCDVGRVGVQLLAGAGSFALAGRGGLCAEA